LSAEIYGGAQQSTGVGGSTVKAALSVLVITHNEERNIAACLESVAWASEVFVVDSMSSDTTQDIATKHGAKVYPHVFEGYAKQRNWALKNLPFSNNWVLMVDADERIPERLREEIRKAVADANSPFEGYYMKPRHFFLGRWIKHGSLYPVWILRLVKRSAGRFEDRPMNERFLLRGEAGHLKEPFDHRDSRPLSAWIAKHNRYSDLEAEEFIQERFGGGYGSALPVRWWKNQPERKRWMKLRIWNRLPLLMRPFLLFARNYFFKAGFLDGKEGFIFHVLWSFWFPFLVVAKVTERQKARIGPPVLQAERGRPENR
jgi:glycosyltransferase involved in cell wall biosynthesis